MALQIRVSPEDVEQLRHTAQAFGTTVSELIRRGFRSLLADAETTQVVPPIPEDLRDAVRDCTASGAASYDELCSFASERLEALRRDRPIDLTKSDADYHDWEALRAWAFALDLAEKDSDERRDLLEAHRKWRLEHPPKPWRERVPEGTLDEAPLLEPAARRTAFRRRLAERGVLVSFDDAAAPPIAPVTQAKQRPRARRTSARRTRAPATDDDGSEPPLDRRPARRTPTTTKRERREEPAP